ncbi:hypothetical protein ACFL3B_02780, partial [Gemmatimonadota bacterium]
EGFVTSLSVMSVSGTDHRSLVDLGSASGMVIIEWSPDGRDLFYELRHSETGQRFWRVPVEGGEPREIDLGVAPGDAAFLHGVVNLRLHPSGRRVAFTSRSTEGEVWVMEDFLPSDEIEN